MRSTFVTIAALALLAILVSSLVRQRHSIQSLRLENVSLRKQAQVNSEDAVTSAAVSPVEQDELERLRKEHAELLRLRGEVGALRRRIGELAARPALAANAPVQPDDSIQTPVVVTNTAHAQANLAPGEAFV